MYMVLRGFLDFPPQIVAGRLNVSLEVVLPACGVQHEATWGCPVVFTPLVSRDERSTMVGIRGDYQYRVVLRWKMKGVVPRSKYDVLDWSRLEPHLTKSQTQPYGLSVSKSKTQWYDLETNLASSKPAPGL
jgi:hypothetical protein